MMFVRMNAVIAACCLLACVAPIAAAQAVCASVPDAKAPGIAIPESVRNNYKVVGGANARVADWGALANLREVQSAGFFYQCGGTLIHPDWVLTAAHCVSDSLPHIDPVTRYKVEKFRLRADGLYNLRDHRIEIVFGVDDLAAQTPAEVYNIVRIETPPAAIFGKYIPWRGQEPADNDIALLKLDRPRCGAPVAQLSPSSAADPHPAGGARTFVAGFGSTKARQVNQQAAVVEFKAPDGNGTITAGSARMQVGAIRAQRPEACARQYPQFDARKQLCAGYDQRPRGNCQGDSGGPLAALDEPGAAYQIGLVSGGKGCAGHASSSGSGYVVYTRISGYLDWIRTIVPDLKTPARRIEPDKNSFEFLRASVAAAPKQLSLAFIRQAPDGSGSVAAGSTFSAGDRIAIRAQSPAPGYLLVYDRDPHGNIEKVEFRQDQELLKLEAGEVVQSSYFTITQDDGHGPGELVAFVLHENIATPAHDVATKSIGVGPENVTLGDVSLELTQALREEPDSSDVALAGALAPYVFE